jgi:hypothetical protein
MVDVVISEKFSLLTVVINFGMANVTKEVSILVYNRVFSLVAEHVN